MMEWTEEVPKDEGLYWIIRDGFGPEIVLYRPDPHGWELTYLGDDGCFSVEDEDILYWMGPIEEPQLPTGYEYED